MPNSNNRKPLQLVLVVAAVLAVAAALIAYLLPTSRVTVAPPAVVPSPMPVASLPVPVPAVEAPVAAKPALTLDQMKEEFAELMKKRSGLLSKCKESQQVIVASRVTTDRSGPANSATAEAYRHTVMELESVLDNHPRVLAIQALYDVAQTDKVAVSRQKADILGAWQKARKDHRDQFNQAVLAANQKTETLTKETLQRAGQKYPEKLSEADRKLIEESNQQMTNEIKQARIAYTSLSNTNAEKQARIQDGSLGRFDALNTRYQELEKQQADVRQQIQKLRDELRRSDPAVAQLQQEAYAASQRHLAAMEAQPEVAAAHKFLDEVDTVRAAIDQRARVLRKAILAAESAYKPMLDQQAAVGGLAQVGEDFWEIAG